MRHNTPVGAGSILQEETEAETSTKALEADMGD